MNQELKITEELKSYLVEISKWTKFLSIVGFIGVGVLILMAFFVDKIFAGLNIPMQEGVSLSSLSVVYFILAGLYFIPVNYMFQFSTTLRKSLSAKDQVELTSAFKNLKSLYKFMGILTIVIMSLYAFAFIPLLITLFS